MWCFNYIHTQIRVHDREKDLRKQVDGIQEKNKNVNTGTSISIHVKKKINSVCVCLQNGAHCEKLRLFLKY